MKMEKLLSSIKEIPGLELECVLFEGNYPIAFTCTDKESKVYLFICYEVNSEAVRWIASETSYDILISMLEDKITIRDAFLAKSEKKYMIEFNGDYNKVKVEYVDRNKLNSAILPTEGEYMEAEDDEFEEEISMFKQKSNFKQLSYDFAGQLISYAFKGRAIVTSGIRLGLSYVNGNQVDLFKKVTKI